MRQFGMTVSQTPESCLARVLPTPALNYGPGSMLKQLVGNILFFSMDFGNQLAVADRIKWNLEHATSKALQAGYCNRVGSGCV